jgi:hypothetical protein
MPNPSHISEEDDVNVLFDIISKWFRDVISLAINDCILVLDFSSFRSMYR